MLAICILLVAATSLAQEKDSAAPKQFTYSVVDGDSLHAFVFTPEKPGATPPAAILLFHGGGWVAGSAEWVFASAQRFADWGLVAIAIDYRLSGDKITPADAIEDACAAFTWARAHAKELGIGEKVAGYGVSAGGHLVAASATVGCKSHPTGRPDAMLLLSPALDVERDGWFARLLQDRGKPADYSPAAHAGKSTPPASIVQGREDTLTPLAGAERFRNAVTEAGGVCELHVFDGVGHLLTRNLADQENNFDPDPEKRAQGIERHRQFLLKLGYMPASK